MADKTENTGSNAAEQYVSPLGRLSIMLNKVCEFSLFVSLVVMTVVTAMQIVFRMFFDSLTWSEELTCFLLVLASFLGTAVAFKRGAHISVTILTDHLPPVLKKVAALFAKVVGLLFFIIIVWYGVVLCFAEASQLSPALEISMFWVYMILPVTSIVVIIHLAYEVELILKGKY
ncbi:MAG: TRAP transporter small permease [Synergistes sp.]|nr:TRAP transporter small permease [Synergistes sp.]